MRLALFGVCAAASLFSAFAAAQELPGVDVRTWRPSTDPNASLVVEPAVTPGPGVYSFGAYTHYAFRPVNLARPDGSIAYRPLEHALGTDVFANLGIGKRLALGLSAPVLMYQTGDSVPRSVANQTSVAPAHTFGDLGVSLKGSILRNEQGGFGLAALGWVSLPTGDHASYASEASTTVTTRILAEYTLLVAIAQASIGYKARTENRTWPAAEVGGVRFGDEIPWSVGLALRPGVLGIDPGNRQRLELAAHGSLPAGPVGPFGSGDRGSSALSPVQLAFSDRIELGHYRDAFVTIGGEVRLTEAIGVPVFRGIVGIGYAPRAHDLDGDGIQDDIDGCPDIPEDKDGYEDADGCPEIDNDDDGIIDKEDACPNVKGVPSPDPKKNGCPGEPPPRPAPKDTDGDGIDDALDKCPTEPEDKDGFQDDDGCPDPDNDRDGIADALDACPLIAGEPSSDPSRNGCPNPDRDGDTFENDQDRCPDSAETFNGVDDEDGCPDEGGKPLVVIDEKRRVRFAAPLKFVGPAATPELDPSSVTALRALVLELNRHPSFSVAVGARPGNGPQATFDAVARSLAVVRVIASLSRRDGIAETVGWDAVKGQPQAETGLAFSILVTPAPAALPKP
jgi:OmpA-OmpF porin, OOP family